MTETSIENSHVHVHSGEHVSADSLSGDSVEKKFTWSLLQALLCYPIMFSKALLLIEHGPAGITVNSYSTYVHTCLPLLSFTNYFIL